MKNLSSSVVLSLLFLLGGCTTTNLREKVDVVIGRDNGGIVGEYIIKAERLRGKKVAFTGKCYSACTFYLWEKFDIEACATDNAWFYFHKPYNALGKNSYWEIYYNDYWNKQVELYPPHVRVRLKNNYIPSVSAGDRVNDFYSIKGTQILQRC